MRLVSVNSVRVGLGNPRLLSTGLIVRDQVDSVLVREKKQKEKQRRPTFWENAKWFGNRAVFHFTHFTDVAKCTMAVPLAYSVMETNTFLVSMTAAVWMYNLAQSNSKANTASLHPRTAYRILNMMIPSIQQHINLERAITSRVHFILAYNPVLVSIFGHTMTIKGPVSSEVYQRKGIPSHQMVYKILGNSKTGDVSFTASLRDHPLTGVNAVSHQRFNPFIGEQNNRWFKVKLGEGTLRVHNDLSYDEFPLDLDDVEENEQLSVLDCEFESSSVKN